MDKQHNNALWSQPFADTVLQKKAYYINTAQPSILHYFVLFTAAAAYQDNPWQPPGHRQRQGSRWTHLPYPKWRRGEYPAFCWTVPQDAPARQIRTGTRSARIVMLSEVLSLNTSYALCVHPLDAIGLCMHCFVSKLSAMNRGKGAEDARRCRMKTVKYIYVYTLDASANNVPLQVDRPPMRSCWSACFLATSTCAKTCPPEPAGRAGQGRPTL